ncbi:unnamed protein product [marine sediment metagenome]|uniref:Uncharacterized protein n=1 Tax=marine sediment metagenome TaxID=412755 RepID=X0ZP37_9ZZZZ
MASFLVRNSLNPLKVVRIAVTFRQQILKTDKRDGELIWAYRSRYRGNKYRNWGANTL